MRMLIVCAGLLLSSWGAYADLMCGIKGRTPVTLRMDMGDAPGSLDPQRLSGQPAYWVGSNLYATLVQAGPRDTFIPDLAKSWEVSSDGLTWTFHLRTSVNTPSGPKPLTWSNGVPFTSQDVVRGIKRLVDPNLASRASFFMEDVKGVKAFLTGKAHHVSGVEAPDDHTVVFHLIHATPYFPKLLSQPQTAPFPKDMPFLTKKGKDQQRHLTNSIDFSHLDKIPSLGAYRLVKVNVNASIIACRNPVYWKFREHAPGPRSIERVVFRPLGSGSTPVHVFERTFFDWKNKDRGAFSLDGIDITASIPPFFQRHITQYRHQKKPRAKASSLLASLDSLVVAYPNPTTTVTYFFNNAQPPFTDVRVRKALVLATPRGRIIRDVLKGGKRVNVNYIPPGLGTFVPPRLRWTSKPYEQRLKEARALFHEAGYSPQHPLSFTIWYNTARANKALSLALASSFAQVFGRNAVHIALANQEWKVYLNTLHDKKTPGLFRSGWVPDYPDPLTYAGLYTSDSPQNAARYRSKAYDALIEKARSTPEERLKYYAQAECLLQKDMPGDYIYAYSVLHLVQPYVKGIEPNFYDNTQVEFLSIDKQNPRVGNSAWLKLLDGKEERKTRTPQAFCPS